MKSLILLFCVAVFALVSCSDSTSTNSTDAKTAIVGTWNVKYAGSSDQTMTFSVSGDSVIAYGIGTKATFSGNNVKFSIGQSGATQNYDLSFSDNNNFNGTFVTVVSGTSSPSISVTGTRKN